MMHLLKKELTELINKQMLIGLATSFIIIIFLGIMMTTTITGEINESGTVRIIDKDKTEFTQLIAEYLTEKGYTVETGEDFAEEAYHWSEAALLPEGLTAQLLERHEPCTIESYTALKSTSAMTMMTSAGSASLVSRAIEELLSKAYLQGELEFLSDPVSSTPYTYANGKIVQADSAAILSSLTMFDQLMPLLLFLLVALTSQTIIGAIAAEKTDKTLEMLLSAPVSRGTIIGAKMLAALIVSLIYAAVYGLGFLPAMLFTVSGSVDNVSLGETFTDFANIRLATQELGLQIPAFNWLGVVVQLMLTLGIALTASMILGGLVEDAKGSQTASMPIMLTTMFPYVLSMVSDIRNMEGGIKWLLYAIPFTHTFIATGNMRFHDSALFWGGLVYQIVFLGVLIFVALRLYSSDLLFVHSGARRKAKEKDAS